MSTQSMAPMTEARFGNLKLFKTGKVRSVYDLGDKLLLVATDRVSAFDHILPTGIPNKGRVLTQISKFWFNRLKIPHHLISTSVSDYPDDAKQYEAQLEGRSMLVKKTELIPVECVVRGYLAGSGWKEYQESGTVCGIHLPEGLKLADKLPQPIFTPARKAEDGHDENITLQEMRDLVGSDLTDVLASRSIEIYRQASAYAAEKGIIIADTKFEFGQMDSGVLLIDEVLTPDSSRFWDAETYEVGISPPSYDKQIVRDHLENSGWNKEAPAPALPEDVVERTSSEYLAIYERLTGQPLL